MLDSQPSIDRPTLVYWRITALNESEHWERLRSLVTTGQSLFRCISWPSDEQWTSASRNARRLAKRSIRQAAMRYAAMGWCSLADAQQVRLLVIAESYNAQRRVYMRRLNGLPNQPYQPTGHLDDITRKEWRMNEWIA